MSSPSAANPENDPQIPWQGLRRNQVAGPLVYPGVKIELPREAGECGRPAKRTGAPCKRPTADSFARACPHHITPEERASAEAQKELWIKAFTEGFRASEEQHLGKIQDLKMKIGKLSAELYSQTLRFEQDGNQIVNVDGYPYLWDGNQEPLRLGEKVLVPFFRGDYVRIRRDSRFKEGVVTSLGTTMRRPLARILGRVEQ